MKNKITEILAGILVLGLIVIGIATSEVKINWSDPRWLIFLLAVVLAGIMVYVIHKDEQKTLKFFKDKGGEKFEVTFISHDYGRTSSSKPLWTYYKIEHQSEVYTLMTSYNALETKETTILKGEEIWEKIKNNTFITFNKGITKES